MNREQFFENLMPIPESGCLVWLGCITGSIGYGQLLYQGKQRRAHRLAWEFERGPIPDGLFVCHKYDVPTCCNVDHLFLGTNSDNMRDCIRKGRKNMPNGEQINTAKLTAKQVIEIRRLLAAGATHIELGQRYGVDHTSISHIELRKTWKYI